MSREFGDPCLPIIEIDLQLEEGKCCGLRQCAQYAGRIQDKLAGRYIGVEQPFAGQIVAAWMNLRNLTYDQYIARAKRRYKGNVLRDARKSDQQGYICKPFVRELFIPDIVAINHSKEERSGGPMKETYLRSVEDMGGAPKKPVELKPPECPVHYDCWWGVFSPEPGYKQGDVVTDERLLAYIDLRRVGNFALYSLILGHGDYLKYGIMYRLHFTILEWLCNNKDRYAHGLDHLVYAGYYQGGEGLQLWKKKTLFEPAYLVIRNENSIRQPGTRLVAKLFHKLLKKFSI